MLPQAALNFLQEAARNARVDMPDRDASLFQAGVLDSFSLVDFVTVLENECNIKVDDSQLRPENFDTIAKVEKFISENGK
jgi:acyl carrier protein